MTSSTTRSRGCSIRGLALICAIVALTATLLPAGAAGANVATGRTAVVGAPGVGQVVAWGDNRYAQTNLPTGLRGVTAIAAGYTHSVAARADGTVIQWGDPERPVQKPPAGLRGVTAVAVGWDHSLALRSDGTVVAWGDQGSGQTNVPAGLTGVTAIAASHYSSLALRSDGTVVSWGGDYSGENTVPVGLHDVTAIAAGAFFSVALRADGTVLAWGGEFGEADVPADLREVTAIAAGSSHTLAVRSDGTVVAWGAGDDPKGRVPPGLDGVVAVSAGWHHSLALRANGSVVAWGHDDERQVAVPAGLPRVTAISAGMFHDLALVTQPWRTCTTPMLTAADVTTLAGKDRGGAWGGWDGVGGHGGYGGDGGSATQAWLGHPRGLARGPDGAIYIADIDNSRIRRLDPLTGIITTIAGTGRRGYGGDGGPAGAAMLHLPSAVAMGTDGDLLVADTANARIRRIDLATGVISTLAGTGQRGDGGDGGPATGARLSSPQGLAVGPDGAVFVADTLNHRVRRIGADGVIGTVAGTGRLGRGGDGGPATASALHHPRGLVVAGDGTLYLTDAVNHRVRKVDAGGVITTVAGSGVRGCYGDGGRATAGGLNFPNGLALGPDGSLYIADASNSRVRRVSPDGIISTLVGAGVYKNGDWLTQPQALLAVTGARLLVSNGARHQVHAVPIPTR